MPRYAFIEQAGRFVAGQTNTSVGTVLTLTKNKPSTSCGLALCAHWMPSSHGLKQPMTAARPSRQIQSQSQ